MMSATAYGSILGALGRKVSNIDQAHRNAQAGFLARRFRRNGPKRPMNARRAHKYTYWVVSNGEHDHLGRAAAGGIAGGNGKGKGNKGATKGA